MGAVTARKPEPGAGLGTSERIVAHMVTTIQAADVVDRPYCHFQVENVFPPDLYAHILDNLPDAGRYKPLNLRQWVRPNGESTRDRFLLTRENVALLPDAQRPLWAAITAALSHPALQRVVFRKLAPDLALRFGIAEDRVTEIEAHPRALLYRDTEQYRIKPHPDGLQGIVTMGFYLPRDMSQADLGTSIYRQRSPWERLAARGKFEEVKRLPFHPNTAYAFVVNNRRDRKSWHGVERVPGGRGVRNQIFFRYIVSPDDDEY